MTDKTREEMVREAVIKAGLAQITLACIACGELQTHITGEGYSNEEFREKVCKEFSRIVKEGNMCAVAGISKPCAMPTYEYQNEPVSSALGPAVRIVSEQEGK